MTESAGSKIKLFNPLTSVFVSSVILYTIFCIYWDTIVTRNIEFYDYLSMLFYPVSYPYDQVSLYYERLKDPYTGHPWGWEFFACLFLAISLLIALFMSIFSVNNTYIKMSIRTGIPLTLVWIAGAFLLLVGNAMG